jgi:pre-mRNA cleavage complex 2 protein Pcf11
MSRKIKLSSAEISRYVRQQLGVDILFECSSSRNWSQIESLLYSNLASQCKQCGMRFHDSVVGKQKMQDHLDMHFRQNRKASQNFGRGHNRSWFTALDVFSITVSVD